MSLLTGHAHAGDQLIRNFDTGPGLNAVGVIEANPDAGGAAANEVGDREEIEGPQAIHSGDRGEIYILDQVNGRVLLLDPKRPDEQTRSLELPQDSHPTDLVVLNESIYIWDGEPRALQAKGPDDGPVRSLSFAPNTVNPAEAVTSAFAQTGSEALSTELDANEITRGIGGDKTGGHSHQLVASHGTGQVTADLTLLKGSTVNLVVRLPNGSLLATLDDKVTIPAGVPLSVEMAARAVGMSVKRARRLMATPAFQADAAVRAYRACMEPANLAAAAEIRDDKTMGPKARLQAIDRIRGPRPVAGVQVNVQQNNGGRTTILPGYVVNLTG